MNKIYSLLFCLSLVVLSCNNKGPNVTEKAIKSISKISPGLPSLYGRLFMFVSVGKDQIGCTDINILNKVYSKYYLNAYKDFGSFLFDVLNRKKILSRQNLVNRNVLYFVLDKNVSEKYNNNSAVSFMNKYCIKKNETSFSIKREYNSKPYLYTILYFCFINNYSVTVNDHIGEYSIVKNP